MPLVSVLIPTYNRATFLRSAIRSVLRQTFQDFEIVALDDGSSDDTRQVIQHFNDSRIRYIRHDQNLGEAKARNECLRQCNGEFVAFLDDDDEWEPQKLEKQLSLFQGENNKVGLVYCGHYSVTEDGRVLNTKISDLKGNLNGQLLSRNIVGPTSAALVKRCYLDQAGHFDEQVVYGMDQDLWIRISRVAAVDVIAEPLVKRTIHEGRLSNNPMILLGGFQSMIRKYPELQKNKSFCYRKYLSIATLFCQQGNTEKGRELFVKAMNASPFQFRPYFFYALSLLGSPAFAKYAILKNRILKRNTPSQDA